MTTTLGTLESPKQKTRSFRIRDNLIKTAELLCDIKQNEVLHRLVYNGADQTNAHCPTTRHDTSKTDRCAWRHDRLLTRLFRAKRYRYDDISTRRLLELQYE